MSNTDTVDVLVVGAGNAALCAASAALQEGRGVTVLERAPIAARGGNGIFTGGLVRFAFDGLDDLDRLAEISEKEAAVMDVGSYSPQELFEDVASLGGYLGDADLLMTLATQSYPTMLWLKSLGVRFVPSYGLHGVEHEGRIRFRGNAPIEVSGGGMGLVTHLAEVVEDLGGTILYQSRATSMDRDPETGRWLVRVRRPDGQVTMSAGAVVLASGGFEANAQMRAQYLGPNWDTVRVRGTEYNTGDGHRMAASVGAAMVGNWSGCHATPTDAATPRYGDRKLLHTFTRHSYHFGIMVNELGERFVDEGVDLETHTYARFGREILKQPNGTAVQIFDSKGAEYIRDEYWTGVATRIQADSLQELGSKLELPDRFLETVDQFNASTGETPFNPTVKDGKRTTGCWPPKSNWAVPIDEPPFYAFPVVCGITFTYGGVRISPAAEVLEEEGDPIPGLFAAGEIIGGMFYNNYPTATGISTGAVFGRAAGKSAALHLQKT